MKKLISAAVIFLTLLESGCGTLFGGQISECQSHRPPKGQPQRQVRGVALVGDISIGLFLFEIPTLVDFLDGAMYKPCEYVSINPPATNPVINSHQAVPAVKNNSDSTNAVANPAATQQTVQVVASKPKGTTSYLDYKYGFRDAKFEMPIESFTDMVPVADSSSNTREQYYHRTTDVMNIGEYQLNEILYIFYHGKLMEIMIETKGLVNSRGLLDMLRDLYGNGFKDNEYIEEYYWQGSKVTLLYDENSITHDARIWFDCTKLSDQNRAEEKKNQRKAETGF